MGLRFLALLLLQLLIVGTVLASAEDSSSNFGCEGGCDEAEYKDNDASDESTDGDEFAIGGHALLAGGHALADNADDALGTAIDLAVNAGAEIENQTEAPPNPTEAATEAAIETENDAEAEGAVTTPAKPAKEDKKVVNDKVPKQFIPPEVPRYPGPLLPGSPPYFLRPYSQPNPYAGPPPYYGGSPWSGYPPKSVKRYPPKAEEKEKDGESENEGKGEGEENPVRGPFGLLPPFYYYKSPKPEQTPTTTKVTSQDADDENSSNAQATPTGKYAPRIWHSYGPTPPFLTWRPYPQPPIRSGYY